MHRIKVRQQLEARTGGGTTNWFTTMTRMIRSEGAASVYKGLSASLLREASYRLSPPSSLASDLTQTRLTDLASFVRCPVASEWEHMISASR